MGSLGGVEVIGALIDGISALVEGTPESSLPLSHHMRKAWEGGSLPPRRGLSREPDHASTLILDFQPPGLREVNYCCSQATQPTFYGMLFQQPEWTRTEYNQYSEELALENANAPFLFFSF